MFKTAERIDPVVQTALLDAIRWRAAEDIASIARYRGQQRQKIARQDVEAIYDRHLAAQFPEASESERRALLARLTGTA